MHGEHTDCKGVASGAYGVAYEVQHCAQLNMHHKHHCRRSNVEWWLVVQHLRFNAHSNRIEAEIEKCFC